MHQSMSDTLTAMVPFLCMPGFDCGWLATFSSSWRNTKAPCLTFCCCSGWPSSGDPTTPAAIPALDKWSRTDSLESLVVPLLRDGLRLTFSNCRFDQERNRLDVLESTCGSMFGGRPGAARSSKLGRERTLDCGFGPDGARVVVRFRSFVARRVLSCADEQTRHSNGLKRSNVRPARDQAQLTHPRSSSAVPRYVVVH